MTTHPTIRHSVPLAIMLPCLGFVGTSSIHATDFIWTGNHSTSWANSANWSQTPGSGDAPDDTNASVFFNESGSNRTIDLHAQGVSTPGTFSVGQFKVDISTIDYQFSNGTVRLFGELNVNSSNRSVVFDSDVTVEQAASGNWYTTGNGAIFDGKVTGSGTIGLLGHFTFNATNPYSGTLRIYSNSTRSGLATIGHANAFANAKVVLNVDDGLDFNVANATFGSLAGNGDLASGSLSLTVGGNNTNTTYSGVLAGDASLGLTKTGTGSLKLSGANTFSGHTYIDAGSIILGNTNALENSTVHINLDDGLNVNGFDGIIGALAGSGNLDLGLQTLTVGGNGANTTYSGLLTGGNLNKIGAPQLTLTGGTQAAPSRLNNLYLESGRLNITGGTLEIDTLSNAPGHVPVISITDPASGSAFTIGINNGSSTWDGVIQDVPFGDPGSITKSGTGTLTLTNGNSYTGGTTIDGGTLSLGYSSAAGTGAITIADDAIIDYANGINVANPIDLQHDATLNVTTGGATHSRVIGETGGSYDILKTGDGDLALNRANTYTGSTSITGGSITIGADNNLGAGGLLGLSGGSLVTNGSFTLARDIQIYDIASDTSTIQINTAANTVTLDGDLSSSLPGLNLNKTGDGSLRFNQTNSFAGTVLINAGSIIPGVSGALRNASVQVNVDGGLDLTNGGVNASFAGLAGSGNIDNSGNDITVRGSNSAAIAGTYGGVLSGSGGLTVASSGYTNTLTLSSANTFTGVTNINGNSILHGTIILAHAHALQNSTVNINADGGLDINGLDATIGALSGSGDLDLGSHTLSIGGNNADTTFSGTLTGDNQSSLQKNGIGTLTLTAASNYSGGTTINGGALLATNATGSATGSGAVTAENGATLGGAGTIAGPVTIEGGGSIAPGNSIGTLTLGGNLTLIGSYACEIGAGNSDALDVGGVLDLTGATLSCDVLPGGATAGPYIIASYGSLTGSFATVSNLPEGYKVDYAYNDGPNSNHVAIVAQTAYEQWAAANGLAPGVNDAMNDDPNQDGKNNLEHYALDTDPLGDGSGEGKFVSSITEEGAERHLVLTLPARAGATFSGSPLTSTAIDGINYQILGSDDLSGWNLTVEEVTPALSSGLPTLDDNGGISGPDWEYHTFRLSAPLSNEQRGFLSVKISTAP